MRNAIESYLKQHTKKKIDTVDLQNHVFAIGGTQKTETSPYIQFAKEIGFFVEKGVLTPIVSRKKYGWNLSLYEGYRIDQLALQNLQKGLAQTSPVQAALQKLHPLMKTEYYARNPAAFAKAEKYMVAISHFLYKADQNHDTDTVSIEQRSLYLFQDEQFLSKPYGKQLLHNLGLTYAHLACSNFHEPFIYELLEEADAHRLLIVEARDTYFLLKNFFQSGSPSICGTTFTGLIYGEGDKIETSFGYLSEIKKIRAKEARIYYFGDIAPKNLAVMRNLMKKYTQYTIEPFLPLYELLLNRHQSLAPTSRRNSRWNRYAEQENILAIFPESLKLKMSLLFARNKYLPQIALCSQDLLDLLH
ncbi:hypothetical protein RI662_20465 [Brevibacillus agri]|uniref:hypothetical protein n=1 Tax=Brevibacillus agri TaxID=51101 RepID=UPI0028707E06|nr:hypothetical protein [Brevibacillus agri]MDR9506640.1 hypothetical protein [Brevibacillus agri]